MKRTAEDLNSRKMIWDAMARVMETGGYLQSILDGGPELDRVKHFVEVLRGNEPDLRDANPPSDTDPDPWVLPVFPGIGNVPFPDPADFEWVPLVERGYARMREEALRIRESFMIMSYSGTDESQQSKWRQGFVSTFGTRIPRDFYAAGTIPEQAIAMLETLPVDDYAGFSHYPFADAFYSWLDPKFTVRGHHSADNFRVRCHLALDTPEESFLRVAGESRTWHDGRALLFDDSFYHEAVNNSERHRLVFITDFWNPGFTMAERRALKAGFGKHEIRLLTLNMREVPQSIIDQFMPVFESVDREDPGISSRWTRKPDASHIPDVIARIRQLHLEAAQKNAAPDN
jgi:aspartate beta-hydroxylase